MCLPLPCLKVIVGIQAQIMLLIGLTTLGLTAYVQIQGSSVISFFDSLQNNIGNHIVLAMWIISGIITLLGIMGVVGAIKKIGCFLFTYNIGNIVAFILFLAVAIFGFIVGDQIKQYVNCDINQQEWSTQIGQAYSAADELLCQLPCQCYLSASSVQIGNPLLPNHADNSSLPISAQECSYFPASYVGSAQFMGQIENEFSCSGWCKGQNYFSFSNVNEAVSNLDGCYEHTVGYITDKAKLAGVISIIVASLLLTFIVLTCCLCCHPQNKQSGNFYAKSAYI